MNRASDSDLAHLRRQIVELVARDSPLSLRNIFYRMTDPTLPVTVPKSENGYKRVGRELKKLRRSGEVSYGAIVDDTRSPSFPPYGGGLPDERDAEQVDDGPDADAPRVDEIREMLRDTARGGGYEADIQTNPWFDCGHYVQVWCESKSLSGMISNACHRLGVSLWPSGGSPSLTFVWQASRAVPPNRDYHVLYIGDLDPKGVEIPVKIERELRRHLPDGFTFDRVAVNDEHLEEFGLTPMVIKGKNTVQAEQMPKAIMVGLLEKAVARYLSDDDRVETRRLDDLAEAEQSTPEWDHREAFDRFWDEHGLDEVFEAYCSS